MFDYMGHRNHVKRRQRIDCRICDICNEVPIGPGALICSFRRDILRKRHKTGIE